MHEHDDVVFVSSNRAHRVQHRFLPQLYPLAVMWKLVKGLENFLEGMSLPTFSMFIILFSIIKPSKMFENVRKCICTHSRNHSRSRCDAVESRKDTLLFECRFNICLICHNKIRGICSRDLFEGFARGICHNKKRNYMNKLTFHLKASLEEYSNCCVSKDRLNLGSA